MWWYFWTLFQVEHVRIDARSQGVLPARHGFLRVHRLDFVADELHKTGMPEGEARNRAAVAVAAYIGWWQLNAVLPEDAPVGRAGRQHAKVLWLICEAALP